MAALLPEARIILDLCAGTGRWSQPYLDAGYDVRRITLPADVRLVEFPGPVHGILAAPPCTVFALSGNRWYRTDADIREGLSVVDACLRLVAVCRPYWWALENPVGKLVHYLGPSRLRFDPYEFGDPYTKRTALWGDFNVPRRRPVPPTEGSLMHRMSSTWKAQRAFTPQGFAKAFFEANP